MRLVKPKSLFREEYFGGISYDPQHEDFFFLDKNAFNLLKFLDDNLVRESDLEKLSKDSREKVLHLEKKGLLIETVPQNRKQRIGDLLTSQRSWISAPTIMEIYPSLICNERCDFCYLGNELNSTKLQFPEDRIDDFVNNISSAGVFNISILGGEPFLYSGLNSLLDKLYRERIDISLSTNGTINKPLILERIKLSKTKLNVSFHSTDKEKQERLVRKIGSFKQTVNTINQARELNIPLHVTTVLNKLNLDDVENLVRFVGDLGVQSMTVAYPLPSNFTLERRARVSFEEYLRAYSRAKLVGLERGMKIEGNCHFNFLIKDYGNNFNPKNPLAKFLYGDKGGRSRLEMMPNGDLYPSSQTFRRKEWYVGNILKDDLRQIWRDNSGLNKIRDRILPEDCQKCEFNEICGGGILGSIIEQGEWDKPPIDCPVILNKKVYAPAGI